jgi:hypothetical protein
VQLLLEDPATAPHDQGVLVVDDSGDRKAGNKTAHVARQYLDSLGKTDNGIVAVTSLWADERVCWPVDVVPYTPGSRLAKGKRDPAFRTKPQLAVELVQAARKAQIGFRAVVADCTCAKLPAAGWGPDRRIRLVIATTDPATLPKLTTWYLVTNLPRPADRAHAAFPPADLAAVVRLYGLRNWVEQGYKQVKHELGWADFQVRSDRAIRRTARRGGLASNRPPTGCSSSRSTATRSRETSQSTEAAGSRAQPGWGSGCLAGERVSDGGVP